MPNEEISFEWDPNKAARNIRKHGISFERAATVFHDPESISVFDLAHSEDEDRWITIGLDNQAALQIVSHTWRESGGGIARCRIFSARKATKNEARQYRAR